LSHIHGVPLGTESNKACGGSLLAGMLAYMSIMYGDIIGTLIMSVACVVFGVYGVRAFKAETRAFRAKAEGLPTEIPVPIEARESGKTVTCGYCHATYAYTSGSFRPDGTVVCQNCLRVIAPP